MVGFAESQKDSEGVDNTKEMFWVCLILLYSGTLIQELLFRNQAMTDCIHCCLDAVF